MFLFSFGFPIAKRFDSKFPPKPKKTVPIDRIGNMFTASKYLVFANSTISSLEKIVIIIAKGIVTKREYLKNKLVNFPLFSSLFFSDDSFDKMGKIATENTAGITEIKLESVEASPKIPVTDVLFKNVKIKY